MKSCICLILLWSSVALAANDMFNAHKEQFDVTDGQMVVSSDHHLMVSSKEFRATLDVATQQHVVLHFKYLGPTEEIAHLQNGEVRHQLGIKLKAQDICNVVYVMWNFDTQKIDIGVKRNPGLRTSHECGDNGYHAGFGHANINQPDPVVVDKWYTFQADLGDKHLKVLLDGKLMWEGDLSDDQSIFTGPVGVRSDNAHVLFDLDTKL